MHEWRCVHTLFGSVCVCVVIWFEFSLQQSVSGWYTPLPPPFPLHRTYHHSHLRPADHCRSKSLLTPHHNMASFCMQPSHSPPQHGLVLYATFSLPTTTWPRSQAVATRLFSTLFYQFLPSNTVLHPPFPSPPLLPSPR